jgi:anti-anti-sigma factor
LGPTPQLIAQVESRNGVTSIALSGELDMASVPLVREHLSRAEVDGVEVIMLDIRDLTFVDSSGLHAFLQARERSRLNGHRFLLIGATASVRRLCELTDTQFLLDDQDSSKVIGRFTGGSHRGTPAGTADAVRPDE